MLLSFPAFIILNGCDTFKCTSLAFNNKIGKQWSFEMDVRFKYFVLKDFKMLKRQIFEALIIILGRHQRATQNAIDITGQKRS